MGKVQRRQNRKQRRSLNPYVCSVCKYASSRRFNIVRHEIRIHSTSKRPRKCCGVVFKTKGEYYLHCEVKHPSSRLTNVTSRTKYKILPNIVTSQLPKKAAFVTSSPKQPRKISYMLRSRVRPKVEVNETKIEFAENVSPKLWTSGYDSDREDVPTEDAADSLQSSGYGTKTSTNSTFDDTKQSCKMELPYSKDRDEGEAPAVQEQLPSLDDKNEIAVKESKEPSPIQFCKNEQTAAVNGENSALELPKIFDEFSVNFTEKILIKSTENPDQDENLAVASVHSENIDSIQFVTSESVNIKRSNENAYVQRDYSGTLSISASHTLPPKKRILLNLAISNGENIANSRKPINDRLFPTKSQNLHEAPFSEKRRLPKKKKKKNRKLQKEINLLPCCSASSDTENVPPLAVTIRKQNAPMVKVDLHADGRFAWDEITQLMRERLRLIDFDSFKIPRCKG